MAMSLSSSLIYLKLAIKASQQNLIDF